MKFFSAFLALALIALATAAPHEVPVETDESMAVVFDLVNELEHIAIDTTMALKHQVDEIVFDPLHQVEEALDQIEQHREENEACVAVHDEHVLATVNAMHAEMEVCGIDAAHTSAEIAHDVSDASQQLLFDGYDIVTTHQKCKKLKNPILKSSCQARLGVKVAFYLVIAPKSIKTIKESKNERIPAVFTVADVCTHIAADHAVAELNEVNAKINACL